MPAQWTADVVGKMHLYGITAKQLSNHMGLNPKYVSTILNGHKTPKGAEEKFKAAIECLTNQKTIT